MLNFNGRILNAVILSVLSVVIIAAGSSMIITQEGPALRGGPRAVGMDAIAFGVLFIIGGISFLVMAVVRFIKSGRKERR
mgnify:CR=1 FL=1